MPISEAVVALLDGKLRPEEAVAALMEREPRARARPRPVERGFTGRTYRRAPSAAALNARMASHFTVAARPASAYSAGAAAGLPSVSSRCRAFSRPRIGQRREGHDHNATTR